MENKIISSPDNAEVKHLKKLAADPDYRYENAQYLIEGVRALDDNGSIVKIYLREGTSLPLKCEAPSRTLAKNLFDKISLTQNSQGVIAVSKLKVYGSSDIDPARRYVLFDRVQDPGNMGSMIRTACAFGFDGAVVMKGCVDPFSPKVVRSSMSGTDKIKIITADSQAQLAKFTLIAADMSGESIDKFRWPKAFIIVIGNEANGISEEMLNACSHRVSIPVRGNIESLNASVAAGIVLFESQK